MAKGAISAQARPAWKMVSRRTTMACHIPWDMSASAALIDTTCGGTRNIHSPSLTKGMISNTCVGAIAACTTWMAGKFKRKSSAMNVHRMVDTPRIGMLPTTIAIATHSAKRRGDGDHHTGE